MRRYLFKANHVEIKVIKTPIAINDVIKIMKLVSV